MEPRPKRLITYVLEFSAVFALAAFLIRLGVCYLMSVRVALIVLAVTALSAAVGFRIWRYQRERTKW
jgi:hypothetical protein